MEKKMIIANQVKSNRSESMVWQVSINNEEQGMQHCISPLKALRYAFFLKKRSGVLIAQESIDALRADIARLKVLQEKSSEAEPIDFEEFPASVKQFNELNEKNPDAVFLFREDDFYTAYSRDAEVVSEICRIIVSRKGNRKAASFPKSALDTYLPQLVKAGKRIAICDPDSEAA